MTSEVISFNWRPHGKTSSTLLNAGFTQEQLNRIGKVFIERHLGKTVDDASTKFKNMVRSSESAHGIEATEPENINEKHKELMSNKSENGEERAKEVKESETSDGMKLKCANMIKARYGTPFDECKKIVGLEIN